MSLGERVKRLRQDRGWSQTQLSQKLKAHQKQISRYERDVNLPSTELLIRVAKIFNVSIDYLVFDDRDDICHIKIADRELIKKMEGVEKLPEQDITTVKAVLDTFITKNRFQRVASESEKIAS